MSDRREGRDSLLDQVLALAAKDLDFRRELLVEPRRAMEREFGVTVPPGHRIRFIEKPADVDTLIVLPEPASRDELDDDDLDAVAGGSDGEDDPPW